MVIHSVIPLFLPCRADAGRPANVESAYIYIYINIQCFIKVGPTKDVLSCTLMGPMLMWPWLNANGGRSHKWSMPVYSFAEGSIKCCVAKLWEQEQVIDRVWGHLKSYVPNSIVAKCSTGLNPLLMKYTWSYQFRSNCGKSLWTKTGQTVPEVLTASASRKSKDAIEHMSWKHDFDTKHCEG